MIILLIIDFCACSQWSKNLLYRLVSKGCKLVGCGSAVPSLTISNDELSKIVDTNDEWISVRTGIRNRRVISGQFIHYVHDNCEELEVA
jgi:hypothetical protein